MKKKKLFAVFKIIGVLFLVLFAVYGVIFVLQSKKIYFFPNNLTNRLSIYPSLICELTYMSGASNLSSSTFDTIKKYEIKFNNYEKQKTPPRYSFQNLDTDQPKIILADSLGITDGTAYKILDTENVIHIVGTWGLNKQDPQVFSIYKKSGFFTYARLGELPLLGTESIGTGFGKCN